MPHTLCEKYGFTQQGRLTRLAMVGLVAADIAIVEKLHHKIIRPHVTQIISKFYDYMLQQASMRKFLCNEGILTHLKKTQHEYLLTLGVNFNSADYFETRLRIGLVHANIGLPMSLYQCSYNTLQELICKQIYLCRETTEIEKQQLHLVMYRLTTLDQSLAMESYFKYNIQNLKYSIETLREKSAALRMEVDFDSLTQVHSRTKILALLEHEIVISRENQCSLAVVMADLDKFKDINDHYGHLVGDQVLRHTATRIQSSLRDIDLIGRYGGEEFIILLPGCNRHKALAITERIRNTIANTPVNYHDTLIPMTVSLGVTIVRSDEHIDSIINRADALMYQSKQQGRNCVTGD